VGVAAHVCPDGLAGVMWNGQALLRCGNLCGMQSFDWLLAWLSKPMMCAVAVQEGEFAPLVV